MKAGLTLFIIGVVLLIVGGTYSALDFGSVTFKEVSSDDIKFFERTKFEVDMNTTTDIEFNRPLEGRYRINNELKEGEVIVYLAEFMKSSSYHDEIIIKLDAVDIFNTKNFVFKDIDDKVIYIFNFDEIIIEVNENTKKHINISNGDYYYHDEYYEGSYRE